MMTKAGEQNARQLFVLADENGAKSMHVPWSVILK